MFETAEFGDCVTKDQFKSELPDLRVRLLNCQFDVRTRRFPIIVLITGDDVPGVSETVDRLHEWLDARYVRTEVFIARTEEEQRRPVSWRYWRAVPPHGHLGLQVGGWAGDALRRRLTGRTDDEGFKRDIAHAAVYERALFDDGSLILKFWCHLPKPEFARRIKRARKNPEREWRIDDDDREIFERYDEIIPLAEHLIRTTSVEGAPWQIIESTDHNHRDLTVARAICTAIEGRLEEAEGADRPRRAVRTLSRPAGTGVLRTVDLGSTLERDDYRRRLEALQARVNRLGRRLRETGRSVVTVFEGWDAAGKGGCIRRITGALAARDYRVIPIAAPSDEEKSHHYLWRFWRHLNRLSPMMIFDRSWYGRVLVERVEGFATEDEWRRAYSEINDFEGLLVEHGTPVFKFWLHMDPDEQLRRFEARKETPYKKYKLTDEDFRNREKWGEYVAAVNDMVDRTSTRVTPWTLVPANQKRFARVAILQTLCDGLQEWLGEDAESPS